MDVATFSRRGLSPWAFVALLALLSACAPSSEKFSATNVDKTTVECAGSALPNQFLVKWADGSISVEQAENSEALERDVLLPNLGQIEYAEHDQRVSSQSRMSAKSKVSTSAGVIAAVDYRTWGSEKIKAPDAWTIAKGSGAIVAVIDSGVDVTHPQLRNQIAINTAEIPGNGIDDDGNGFVDDYLGYDFYNNSGDIKDDSGHGTHVAGVILAEHQSTSFIRGIAPEAKLLALDFMDGRDGMISDAIRAIEYATSRGARVINASWGGSCSKTLSQVVRTLEARGVLFVTAAGNGNSYGIGVDLGTTPTYPAAFEIPGQITVGASNYRDVRTGFSNYSTRYVHIVAPGEDIYSTYPSSLRCTNTTVPGYCYEDGTSMATPFVSGAAAVLFGHRPNATVAQVRDALLLSVDKGEYAVSSNGRLNVKKALEEIEKLVP